MEHLYGATVAGKLKYWTRNNHNQSNIHVMLIQISLLVLRHSHRPLFIPLPDVERVLEDGVHDSPDAKGRLDYIGNNLLHCGKIETVVFPHEKLTVLPQSSEAGSVSPLTVQSFLEPLHADHVFGQFECLACCLEAELPTDTHTHTKLNHSLTGFSSAFITAVRNYPFALRSFS